MELQCLTPKSDETKQKQKMGNDKGFIVPEMLCCHGNSVWIVRPHEILLVVVVGGGGRGKEGEEGTVMLMNDEWSFLTFFNYYFLMEYDYFCPIQVYHLRKQRRRTETLTR